MKPQALDEFFAGKLGTIALSDGSARMDARPPCVLFPGAFNPLHAGHREIATVATRMTGEATHFELSVANVDKPEIARAEVERRLQAFQAEDVVWLTRAPTFEQKSALFPQVTFVVGADTIKRVAMPRYYGNDADAMHDSIAKLVNRGNSFLVFGRKIGSSFVTLGDLELTPALKEICTEIPESEFRADISSTELR